MYTVEFGIHGARRITEKEFDNPEAARRFAVRWSESNSTGDYWAVTYDFGTERERFNLPRPYPGKSHPHGIEISEEHGA